MNPSFDKSRVVAAAKIDPFSSHSLLPDELVQDLNREASLLRKREAKEVSIKGFENPVSYIRLGCDKVFGSNYDVQYPRPSHYHEVEEPPSPEKVNQKPLLSGSQPVMGLQKWKPRKGENPRNQPVELDLTETPKLDRIIEIEELTQDSASNILIEDHSKLEASKKPKSVQARSPPFSSPEQAAVPASVPALPAEKQTLPLNDEDHRLELESVDFSQGDHFLQMEALMSPSKRQKTSSNSSGSVRTDLTSREILDSSQGKKSTPLQPDKKNSPEKKSSTQASKDSTEAKPSKNDSKHALASPPVDLDMTFEVRSEFAQGLQPQAADPEEDDDELMEIVDVEQLIPMDAEQQQARIKSSQQARDNQMEMARLLQRAEETTDIISVKPGKNQSKKESDYEGSKIAASANQIQMTETFTPRLASKLYSQDSQSFFPSSQSEFSCSVRSVKPVSPEKITMDFEPNPFSRDEHNQFLRRPKGNPKFSVYYRLNYNGRLTDQVYVIMFNGQTFAELKVELLMFDSHFKNQTRERLGYSDIDILFRDQILKNHDLPEAYITTETEPLIVFIPTDLQRNEFQHFMQSALSVIDQYKRKGMISSDMSSLQMQSDMENLVYSFALQFADRKEMEEWITGDVREKYEGFLARLNYEETLIRLAQQDPVTFPPALVAGLEPKQTEQINLCDDDEPEKDDELCILAETSLTCEPSNLTQITYKQSSDTQSAEVKESKQAIIKKSQKKNASLLKLLTPTQQKKLFEAHERAKEQVLRSFICSDRIHPNNFRLVMKAGLGSVQVSPLIEQIQKLQRMWGGVEGAYDMEWKIRSFVMEVLNFALLTAPKQNKNSKFAHLRGVAQQCLRDGLKLDGEKGIEHGNGKVCPDLTVQSVDDRHMIYIVEIKNLRTKQGKGIIRTAIHENFKQLRNYCLQRKVEEMWGISTNFAHWVFTKYSKIDEMQGQGKNPFQVTECVELMETNSYKLREEEIQKLVVLLDLMAKEIIQKQIKYYQYAE